MDIPRILFSIIWLFSVAVFFFLSGYGLMVLGKNESSVMSFPRKKILPFYLLIILSTSVYAIYSLICGETLSVSALIRSITFGVTIIENGWYLQTQLLYYFLFYFVFRFVKEQNRLFVMAILHILFICICVFLDVSSLYYERTFIFLLGMIWYQYRERIDEWLNRRLRSCLTLVVSFVLFVFFYLLTGLYLIGFETPPAFSVICRSISYFFFIPFVFVLIRFIRIDYHITRFLGKISLEIYVFQGLFMSLFRSKWAYLDNPYVFVLVSAVSTILFSWAVHPVTVWIYGRCRKVNLSLDEK